MDTVTKPFTTNAELSPQPVNRLNYIDNIRWVMIILVVLMHIKVTYAMEGSWYYVEKSQIDFVSRVIFAMYGSWVQAFFMGFLFFIAGYFVPGSYDQKGFPDFMGSRFFRLGIPTLVYMLLLHPLTVLIKALFSHQSVHILDWYLSYIASFEFIGESGPLWFAFALLIFSVIYAFFRQISSKIQVIPHKNPNVSHKGVIAVILIISLLAFLIRTVQPIGTSVLNMQLCFFAQYIVLFILGILAYRQDWLNTIRLQLFKSWLKIALFCALPFWFLMFFLGATFSPNIDRAMGGGFYWESAIYAFWESLFCVSICLGLIGLFKQHFNKKGSLSGFLSDNAFGVYVFHAPILVFISLYLRNFHIYPLSKSLLVAVITLPICFCFSYLVRRVPLFKKVFS